jgi:hypothetical protein
MKIKGPVEDQRAGIIWMSFLFGMVLMSTAAGRGGWAVYRAWQRRQAMTSQLPTVTEQTLQKLQRDAAQFFRTAETPDLPVGVQLDHIIRVYLQEAHQVPAFTLTPAELAGRLEGVPCAQDVVHLIERCAALKYQPPAVSLTAAQHLWRDTIALFQRLQQEGMP